MRTSGPRTTSVSARGFAAGIALVSVAALGACASSASEQPPAVQAVVTDSQAGLALQGIVHPPREFVEQRLAESNARAALAAQGIVLPPREFLEQRLAESNARAALAAQGIVHPPREFLEQRLADSNTAARLALQGIVAPQADR